MLCPGLFRTAKASVPWLVCEPDTRLGCCDKDSVGSVIIVEVLVAIAHNKLGLSSSFPIAMLPLVEPRAALARY